MSMQQAMTRAAREAGIEIPLRYHDVTESTNTTALRLADEGAPEWTIVVAGHQTGGKGRLGRTWLSEPGAALLCSVVLWPDLEASRAGLLTLLAGVAMAEAARVACDAEVRCKWPNDLMVGERKAGGILAESAVAAGRLTHVVIGAGVNVAAAPADAPRAASLGGGDPAVLLQAYLSCLKQRYHPGDEAFAEELLEAYRRASSTIGRRVRAMTTDGRTIDGVATGVDASGNLLVESDGETEVVAHGEIAHLDG